jgi:NTE family protein
MAGLPSGVTVHVLPTGSGSTRDDSPLAYRDVRAAKRRMDRAYAASLGYLESTLDTA